MGHFRSQITGRILEPCEGGGAFTRACTAHGLTDVIALEITRGSDFFEFHERVDWIVTNPPWSLARQFIQHAYRVADNVVFLIILNHVLNLRARIADMGQAGFGIREVLLCATPPLPWPQSGFQLAAIHLSRGYRGAITWGWLNEQDLQGHGSAAPVARPKVHILRASAFAIPLRGESVQTVVTSPSYFGLRRYAGGTENDLGREKTVREYVEHLVIAMREVRRVLRSDGVVFLNLGDSYHSSGRGLGDKLHPSCKPSSHGMQKQGKAKSLCLIPQRAMIALENDGWIVRNDVIWQKPNAVPESVKDRCTCSYEHIIILTKQQVYYWNTEEAVEPAITAPHAVGTGPKGDALIANGTRGERTVNWDWDMRHSNKTGASKTEKRLMPPIGNKKHQALGKGTLVGNRAESKWTRNMRDVWSIPTKPHKDAHIAMFPEELVERCIRIASRPGDTVMDCFAGSGTTGIVARQLGRNSILLDISAEYCRLMKNRLSQQPEAALDRGKWNGALCLIRQRPIRRSFEQPVIDVITPTTKVLVDITQPLQLFHGDCLTVLPTLPARSVDLVLTDLSYGVTACEWDSVIPLDKLWDEYRRVAKETTAFVFTATQPFTTRLISSCKEWFRYELIWEKPQGTNPLNAKRMPLKSHESIVVFYKKQPTYNPQMEKGVPYSGFVTKDGATIGEIYGSSKSIHAPNSGTRYPKSVLRFKQEKGLHPTQKPVSLMEYLIRTYTNEGDVVLDNCMGSGTTGVAALNLKRKFIGIESDPQFFSIAEKRLDPKIQSRQALLAQIAQDSTRRTHNSASVCGHETT